MMTYDDARRISGLTFTMKTPQGSLPFRLPVNTEKTTQVLKNQYYQGKAPRSVLNDGQAERVAWRIVKDWMEAQIALIQIEMVTLDQIFLPYAVTPSGQTLYDVMQSNGGLRALVAGNIE